MAIERIERLGGTRTGHSGTSLSCTSECWSRSYVLGDWERRNIRGLLGNIGEFWGEMLEIGGLKIAQTGSKCTEGSGLNTPL